LLHEKIYTKIFFLLAKVKVELKVELGAQGWGAPQLSLDRVPISKKDNLADFLGTDGAFTPNKTNKSEISYDRTAAKIRKDHALTLIC